MELDVGPFRLTSPFARGAMGEVWRAWHREQRLPVALKVVTGAAARSDRYLRHFQNEVRAVASLDHPSIVTVLDVGTVDAATAAASEGRLAEGSPWLAMEYASDGTLSSRTLAGWPEIRRLLFAILGALAHAHARGITHRDLKPANILFCGDRDPRPGPKLTDFGIAARFGEDDPSDPGAGTPAYMAPEQLLGEPNGLGPWTDLYALGCVAWRLACGKLPFEGLRRIALVRAHLLKPLPVFEPVVEVPDGLEGWLRALLAKKPEDRPQRAADAAAALVAVESGEVDDPEARPFAAAWREGEDVLLSADLETAEPEASEAPRRAIGPPPFVAAWREPVASRPPVLLGAGLGLFGLREPVMVGRPVEQDLLWDELRAVHGEPAPRLVVIGGPAGTGKTRLASWLCRRADELGLARVLWVVPRAGDDGGLVPMIRRMLRVEGMEREKREKALPLAVPDPDVGAAVAALLAGELDAARSREVVAGLVADGARERPVILVVDDAHWSGSDLEVCASLLGRSARLLQVVLVQDEALATRPRERALLDRLEGLRLALGPLDGPATRELVAGLLPLEDELAMQVETRTGGNPQFAVQLVGEWVERGWLVPGERGFGLRDDARRRGALAFPDDLHHAWIRRVERVLSELPVGADRDLEIAAALGPEVDGAIWHRACGADGDARRRALLEGLLRARLATSHPEGWTFAHEMLRESVIRHARERGRWPAASRASATALQGHGARHPERIGRLLVEAGDPGAALVPLLDGVDRLRSTAAREALALLVLAEQASAAASLPPGDPLAGRFLVARARVHQALGEPDEALKWAVRARRAADDHSWPDHYRAALDVELAIHLNRRDLLAARAAFALLAPLVRADGDPRSLGDLLNAEAGLLQGDPAQLDRADALLVEAGARYRESGASPQALATVLVNRALLAKDAGALDRARALLEEALDALGVGKAHRFHSGVALSMLAEVWLRLGDASRAEPVARRAIAVLEPLGHPAAEARVVLGLVLSRAGRHDEALPELTKALRTSAADGRVELVGVAALAVALVEGRLGRWAAVHDRLREAERSTTAVPLDTHARELAVELGRLAGDANFPQIAARARALA